MQIVMYESLKFLRVLLLMSLVVATAPVLKSHASTDAQTSKSFKVKYVNSKPAALLRFVDTLAERSATNDYIRAYYARHHKPSREESQVLKTYKQFVLKRYEAYQFGSQFGTDNLDKRMEQLAAESTDVQSLLKRIMPITSTKDWKVIAETLTFFEPIYDQVIWRNSLPELQRQLNQLKSQEAIMDRCLNQVRILERSESASFTVCLVPIPRDQRRYKSTSECMGNLEILEVGQGETYKNSLPTIFHEICHAIWKLRSPELDRMLQKTFVELNAQYAWRELNEGLTTALAQGWFVEQIGGTLEEHWYGSDGIVNANAHALLPIVRNYLASGKVLDKTFAVQAANVFKRRLENADTDVAIALSEVIIFSQVDNGLVELKQVIPNKLDHVHGVETCVGSFACVRTRETIKRNQIASLIFLIRREEIPLLKQLGISPAFVRNLVLLPSEGGNALAYHRDGGRWLIFAIGPNYQKQKEQLFRLLGRKTIRCSVS